jgi:osmotically-inducible protein OsmY
MPTTVPLVSALQAPSPEAQRLAERVRQALEATGYGPLRRLTVTVLARRVVLAGHVPSYYLKQVAQTAVLAVPGTHQVRNDLDVVVPP